LVTLILELDSGGFNNRSRRILELAYIDFGTQSHLIQHSILDLAWIS
jgi:hypothetical protein